MLHVCMGSHQNSSTLQSPAIVTRLYSANADTEVHFVLILGLYRNGGGGGGGPIFMKKLFFNQ